MKEELIKKAYEIARERYAAIGVDTDKVLEQMQDFHLSMHCWQADDVAGFENQGGSLTGGIQVNGNYPGKARNIDELRADVLYAMSLIPGKHRLNLHEIYGDFGGKFVDRDQVTPEHFRAGSTGAVQTTSSSTSTLPRSLTPRAATCRSLTPTRASVTSDRAQQALPRYLAGNRRGSERPLYHEHLGARRQQGHHC